LISVDTLRHDRVGFAGYQRPTSTKLDALAERSTVFTNAYSQSGWTLPSMATIMTGRYPKEHGAIDFGRRMDPTLPTIATILKAQGYDTGGFVSHVLLTPFYGFDRGFSQFDTSALKLGVPREAITAGPLTDKVIAALATAGEPFFFWVHYFDPHFEYRPHEPWSSFGTSASDRYDQEIASTDFQIGRLMEALEKSDRLDSTIVIFTSDHGEEFGEHGGEYHYTLYDEVVRVPSSYAPSARSTASKTAMSSRSTFFPLYSPYSTSALRTVFPAGISSPWTTRLVRSSSSGIARPASNNVQSSKDRENCSA
jgi:arylsulfatase A-like enzyme